MSRRQVFGWLRRGGLLLVTALVVEYVVVPELTGARTALDVLAGVSAWFLVAGLALELASLAAYSQLTRCVLPAGQAPPFWTVLRIDVSGLGLSHLLPGGGATASALRFRLLTVAGVPVAGQVAAAAIQATGLAVMLALVFGAGLVVALPEGSGGAEVDLGAVIAVVLLAVAGASVLVLTRWEPRAVAVARAVARRLPRVDPGAAQRLVEGLATRLRQLGSDRRLLVVTLGWACASWALDAMSLWVFLRAFGLAEGLRGLLLGYGLAGVLALLPLTPGGLGVVEGTLVAVLVGFGAPQAPALLGVIAWRLVEFWLPIPLAAASYLSLRTGTLRPHRLPARPLIPRPGVLEVGMLDDGVLPVRDLRGVRER